MNWSPELIVWAPRSQSFGGAQIEEASTEAETAARTIKAGDFGDTPTQAIQWVAKNFLQS